MTVWKPLMFGLGLALVLAGLFRVAGHLFFIEGRDAANVHAVVGAAAGLALGWLASRQSGHRGVMLAVIPGLLLMAVITSHFSLAFPKIDPRLDKGFGGLMLWLYGFMLAGGLLAARPKTKNGDAP